MRYRLRMSIYIELPINIYFKLFLFHICIQLSIFFVWYICILFQKKALHCIIASFEFIFNVNLPVSKCHSDEDKCGECAPFIICSRRHMGEWHGLNEKLVQTLLTHFYSTHDLDDRESVQTYCEHLHLFFTVHWLNRNALTITWLASLTHFKLKKRVKLISMCLPLPLNKI